MRIVEVKDIERSKFYKRTKYFEIIQEFLDSDMIMCEIVDFDCKNAGACAYSMRKALNRMHVLQVESFACDNRVFIRKIKEVKKE